ncbi:MAG: hypothetical protein PUH88_03690 [Lachnospiraceae bacterium]|nr:hypothetical protein [Lachnospiraceae bacterium]
MVEDGVAHDYMCSISRGIIALRFIAMVMSFRAFSVMRYISGVDKEFVLNGWSIFPFEDGGVRNAGRTIYEKGH